ncbi:MAG: DUF4404 family protein [Elusimicrobia bacterium]|nr:DUF4404 family protein [Elusimicrobiota bacterium]
MATDALSKLEAAISRLKSADKKEKAALRKLVGDVRKDLKRTVSLSKRLAASAAEFEVTYPTVAKAVNEICRELAALGI